MAVFTPDFSTYVVGELPPGWWQLHAGTLTAQDAAGQPYGKVVRLAHTGGTEARLSDVGEHATVRVLAKMRYAGAPSGWNFFQGGFGLIAKALLTGNSNRVRAEVHPHPSTTDRFRMFTGAFNGTRIDDAPGLTVNEGVWVWLLLEAAGDTYRAWQWLDGATPKTVADTPDLEGTGTVPNGGAGFITDSRLLSHPVDVAWFSVGTGTDLPAYPGAPPAAANGMMLFF